MNQKSMEERWSAYLAAFATNDESERKRLLDECVSDEVFFTNPSGEGQSKENLFDHIDKFQKKMPGAYFTTDRLYPQADKLLAVWTMFKKDGTKVATGYNFVRPDEDGRFSYMAGFF